MAFNALTTGKVIIMRMTNNTVTPLMIIERCRPRCRTGSMTCLTGAIAICSAKVAPIGKNNVFGRSQP